MADTELQAILSGGAITNIQIGGATVNEAVPVKSELKDPSLQEVGITNMRGANIAPQSLIADTPAKVNLFDTKVVEAGVGVSGYVVTQRATATLNGLFKIRLDALVDYASNVDITWDLYKNGSPTGVPVTISGQGATAFQIVKVSTESFVATDYIELYATASADTTLKVHSAYGSFEKTIF